MIDEALSTRVYSSKEVIAEASVGYSNANPGLSKDTFIFNKPTNQNGNILQKTLIEQKPQRDMSPFNFVTLRRKRTNRPNSKQRKKLKQRAENYTGPPDRDQPSF